MEEMISKFPNSAKMRARYQQYLKKRLLAVQIIKNAIGEKELMVEIMASTQNIGFASGLRRSLFTQQNPGLSSVKAVSQLDAESALNFGYSAYETAASSNQPIRDERIDRMKSNIG